MHQEKSRGVENKFQVTSDPEPKSPFLSSLETRAVLACEVSDWAGYSGDHLSHKLSFIDEETEAQRGSDTCSALLDLKWSSCILTASSMKA